MTFLLGLTPLMLDVYHAGKLVVKDYDATPRLLHLSNDESDRVDTKTKMIQGRRRYTSRG